MAFSAPDLFTTLRYIPSGSPDGPTKEDVPLFDLHVARLQTGYREWSGLREADDNTPFWAARIWNALEQVIIHNGPSHNLRLKVTLPVSAPPTFRAEGWILPDMFPPFGFSLPSTPPASRSPLPHITLSPAPVKWTEETLPLLMHKTSDRHLYDEHTALTLPTYPATQSTLLYTEPPRALITETTITNVLFLTPGHTTWITPQISSDTPALPGLMREYLLSRNEIEEAEVPLQKVREWLGGGQGGRVACCNALRGVWEVTVELGSRYNDSMGPPSA